MSVGDKLLKAAAGNTAGDGPFIEDFFSNTTYIGDSADGNHPIGINITQSGDTSGFIWLGYYIPGSSGPKIFIDTTKISGTAQLLRTDSNSGYFNESSYGTGDIYFISGGRLYHGTAGTYNGMNTHYWKWAFMKQEGFMDFVHFNSNSGSHGTTTHSHSLGVVPEVIIIKATNTTSQWFVFHKDLTNNSAGSFRNYLQWNSSAAQADAGSAVITATDTQFTFNSVLTDHSNSHIAILLGEGDTFGTGGDNTVFKSGIYTGNGDTDGALVDLGWEPQWVQIKRVEYSGNWQAFASTAGMGGGDGSQAADDYIIGTDGGYGDQYDAIKIRPNGFLPAGGNNNNSGNKYFYMAIRKDMKPADHDDISNTDLVGSTSSENASEPYVDLGFRQDTMITFSGSNIYWIDRLRPRNVLNLSSSARDFDNDSMSRQYFHTGAFSADQGTNTYFAIKRAPKFYDMAFYPGTGSAHTVPHNLEVVPELMLVKQINDGDDWALYTNQFNGGVNPQNYGVLLGTSASPADDNTYWNDTAFTDTHFSVGTNDNVNKNYKSYAAYLFASIPGICKIGTYTGSSSAVNIDLGFTAKWFFLKKLTQGTSGGGKPYIQHSAAGITTGNDDVWRLHGSKYTNFNVIEPITNGVQIQTGNTYWNEDGETFLYWAMG